MESNEMPKYQKISLKGEESMEKSTQEIQNL